MAWQAQTMKVPHAEPLQRWKNHLTVPPYLYIYTIGAGSWVGWGVALLRARLGRHHGDHNVRECFAKVTSRKTGPSLIKKKSPAMLGMAGD